MTSTRQMIADSQHIEHWPFPITSPRTIRNVICEDGTQRTAYCSMQGADTFFSIPARVYANGKTVRGYVTKETFDGFTVETEGDPAVWKFIAYKYLKNYKEVSPS